MVVNKSSGSLGPSETFLRAQLNGLPCHVTPLIGNPGFRCKEGVEGRYLMSRGLLSLGFRWLSRSVGLTSLSAQDTESLVKYIERENFDVVLAQYGPTAVTVMNACKHLGVPLVVHFHGFDAYSEYVLGRYEFQYKQLFKQAAAIIAVSTHMKTQLINLGSDPEKTIYSSCGAELPEQARACPSKAGLKYIMVGRLTHKKAPLISIRAFKQLVDLYPEATLDIVGDGALREDSEKLVASLGIQKNITFHGVQPHEKVIEYMASSRCFIQHSVCAPNGDRPAINGIKGLLKTI